MKVLKFFAGCLLSLLLLGVTALGQILEGTISGRVQDSTGAVMPGAEVVLLHVERGVKRTTLTND
ncbi:MAG: carboxypeptidase regulatory-like domain-containing protein, partial [Acidobacteria bacterium]